MLTMPDAFYMFPHHILRECSHPCTMKKPPTLTPALRALPSPLRLLSQLLGSSSPWDLSGCTADVPNSDHIAPRGCLFHGLHTWICLLTWNQQEALSRFKTTTIKPNKLPSVCKNEDIASSLCLRSCLLLSFATQQWAGTPGAM